MLGKTHAVSGAAAALAVAPLLNAGPAEVVVGMLVASGSAVLPDIDHPDATIAMRLGVLGQFLATGIERISGGHRKGTHTLLALAAVGVFTCWLLPPVGVAVLTAFTAWIGFDLLTRAVGAWKIARLGLLIGAGVGVLTHLGVVAPVQWALPLGYLMHLVGDALTTQRISPFFPFSNYRFGLPLFETGSSPETVLRVLLILGTVALAWFLHLEGPVMGLIDGLPSVLPG